MTFKHEYDVAVVGAGPAGVTAATSALDAGAGCVALIESSNRLGGSVSAAMHRSLCGLYSRQPDGPAHTLNDGAQRDIVSSMMRLDRSAVVPRQLGKTWVLEFPIPAWEASLAEHCARDNIDRLMECRVTAVRRDGDLISLIQVNGSADRWIRVKAVIDCTGGGSILPMAGENVTLPPAPDGRMLGGFSIRLAGVSGDPELLRIQTPYVLAKAVASGVLPPEARFTMFQPGPGVGEGICKLAVNPTRFSNVAIDAYVKTVVDCLKSEVPGFSAAKVIATSPHALARDGNRLRGKYIVTEDDVLQGRQRGADCVHAWWPIERWDVNDGPSYAYPPTGQHYDIPPEAMQSAVVDNLFAAGTCVSATAGASASLRASGICLATGHAAGRLAASRLT